MLRKQINGAKLRGVDGIDRTLNAVTLSEDEKKKIGELDFLPNDVLLATEVKAVAANDKIGITEAEVADGLKNGKWIPLKQGTSAGSFILAGANLASETNSFAGGYISVSSGNSAFAYGYDVTASGIGAHGEGCGVRATTSFAHAEGHDTNASGTASHAEGANSSSKGAESHAEGHATQAIGKYSHSECNQCSAVGENSHAEGYCTISSGENSHTEGDTTTTTTTAEHAEGKYNYSEKDMFISTIGVGGKDDRKNGVAVGVTGELFLIGVGGYEGQSNASAKSVQSLLQSYEQRIAALETKIKELENASKSE